MQPLPHPAEFDERRDAPRVEIARRYSMRLDPCDGRGPITCALLDYSVTGVRLELPDNFQTSEFLLQHGFIERIVHRKDLRTEVARIIDYCDY